MGTHEDARRITAARLSRRGLLRWGAAAAAGGSLAAVDLGHSQATSKRGSLPSRLRDLEEATIAELQERMGRGRRPAQWLVNMYLQRVKRLDPLLQSFIEVNPDAREIARALDDERRESGSRGPLHGIPIVLKDNIDTHDDMMTTAGSLALVGAPPDQDATVAARLRDAGAILFGKANMSEWANFRSTHSSSGWCARNGQSNNPYVLNRNPCGSSSGSGIAVSANLAAVAIGTETDGSIVCPANANGVVGLKPTVGLVSRAGVVPISHTQDTIGPLARTVADAAIVMGAITGVDPRDPATEESEGNFFDDYTQFLDADGLQGARIGVARNVGFGPSEETDRIIESAIQAIRDAGAEVVDPADIPGDLDARNDAEFTVLLYEFKNDLNEYLATRHDVALDLEGFGLTLAGAIAFNEAYAEEELKWFLQEIFEMSEALGPLTDLDYQSALATSRDGAREALDQVMDEHNLDALVAPTGSPAWPTDLINGDHFVTSSSSPTAQAGYPLISVPAGYSHGLPVNVTFMGRAWSEPDLIRVAYAYEQATQVRRAPEFIPQLDLA